MTAAVLCGAHIVRVHAVKELCRRATLVALEEDGDTVPPSVRAAHLESALDELTRRGAPALRGMLGGGTPAVAPPSAIAVDAR